MNLPRQASPVSRQTSGAKYGAQGVAPSSITCDICMAGCNLLSGFAKTLCVMGCNATVCP